MTMWPLPIASRAINANVRVHRVWHAPAIVDSGHTTTLVNDLMSDDYLHDCGDLLTELSDHVNGMVKGQ